MKEPKNIFEQILFGVEATNENVVTLSENINVLSEKLDKMLSIMDARPVTSGVETSKVSTKNI